MWNLSNICEHFPHTAMKIFVNVVVLFLLFQAIHVNVHMYAYILTKLFWWYFKIMVPHYGLQKYTYIFWSFNVLLQFYLVNRSLKFLVVIDYWQYNPNVCDQYHMYPFSSLSLSSSHFQWPLQCVELMKRSAGLWSREMGPTTVTWPDWGTGSQEIPRMVMIFWWGHNVTKVTINRMLPNWPSRHTLGVFLMPLSLSRMSQRFLDPGSPNMHQNRQKRQRDWLLWRGWPIYEGTGILYFWAWEDVRLSCWVGRVENIKNEN